MKYKLNICIAIPGLAFNGNTFDKQSLGGSETAGYYMAKALAKLGHNVTVFCNGEPARCTDVDYLPLSMYQNYAAFTPHDISIIQRAPEFIANHINAKFTMLWCHDLSTVRSAPKLLGAAWNYDKIAVLSKFMYDQYRDTCGVPEELLFLTRNGVDLATVKDVKDKLPKDVTRNPLALIFSARPERGLDILLAEIFPRILKAEPNATLYLSSYDNKVDHLAGFYAACEEAAKQFAGRVLNLGHLTKAQLYEAYHASGVYVYPVPSTFMPDFDEISCISLMEAQACGLPIVSSSRGALPETLGPGAGTLITEPIFTPAYFDAFANACLKYMRDAQLRQVAGDAGAAHAQTLDWDGVAKQWETLFESEIRSNSSDLATLANHFWRRSDIYAARECLRRLPQDDKKSAYARKRVMEDWAFLDEQDGFRKQYERIGGTHDARVIDWSPREPRYAAVKEWINKRIAQLPEGQILNVLDYGCAHGGYATNLLKEIPRLRITGVDIDMHGIEMAGKFAAQLGVSDRWTGVVGSYDRLSDPNIPEFAGQQFDAAIAQEVLEHVEKPGDILIALEAKVKDDGDIWATVPHGPWEYTDYKRYPYRAHIWEFDLHDLKELFAPKDQADAKVSINSMPYGLEPLTTSPLGWWVINYKVTVKTRGLVGTIDMDRKLWLQRPRQTLSATIMAGGPSVAETLLWHLRSMQNVVDELVIVDCGLNDDAKYMLNSDMSPFNDGRTIIVPGVDPKVEGFETPRNIAIKHATQDWILWIDTDEKLLQPENIHKYLRKNIYQGYSIKQHHFAVDTNFEPDMPVRLFRNNGKMRFFGMIHEHPEEDLNKGPGRTVVISDVHIPHLGYLIESGRRVRFDRNYPMLQKDIAKYPARVLQKHFIMRDNMLLAVQELQSNGMKITSNVMRLCEETVALYRQYFMGKGFFTNADPIGYYSQAVGILASKDQRGFDLSFNLATDKVSSKLNGGGMTVRFANAEDALTEITHRVKSATAQYNNRYF